ncbi:hypothetical protein V6255_17380 [Psychromonas arctica]|uniref:Uncharacterized protein n=1 Tax=Psychromonas arctica TaxID=168275 RepID=A0ABU9HG74_9GAMM
MFKTLSKVLVVFVVIVIVSYFLQNRANTPEACANIDGYWNADQNNCEDKTEKMIFQSLSKPHPVSIVYPDNQRLVSLDKAEQVEQEIYLRGYYQDLVSSPELKATEQEATNGQDKAVYERGSVFLNMSKLSLLADNRVGITYFAAPFVINTAGRGIFDYIGLFSYDFASQQATHLRSELLGSRIREQAIVIKEKSVVKDNVFVQEGVIEVHFKSHGLKQAAADYPTQSNKVTLQLVALDPKDAQHAAFRRITIKNKITANSTMHKSWDTDSDGINDCEKQNSCDHTVDYSQEKTND